MISKRKKAAFLPLLLLLAVAATAAAPAQAVHYKATSPPGTLSGSAEAGEEIKTEAGSVFCAETSLSAAYTVETFSSLKLHPTFKKCKAFGFVSATVNTEECNFFYTPTNYFALFVNANLDISCPALQSIKVTASTCSMEIKDVAANSNLSQATILHGGGLLLIRPEFKKLAYVVTNDGFLCPFSGTGEKTGGEYVSSKTVEVFASPGTIDIVE